MANVILDNHLGDRDALYVWAGVTGPQWGGWVSFASSEPTRAIFPEQVWQDAIEAASTKADQTGILRVYVARNG